MDRPARLTLVALFWLAAMALAATLDRPVAQWVHSHEWDVHKGRVNVILKLPGEYVSAIIAVIVAGLLHREKWRAALLIGTTQAISGVNGLLKWIVGRHRPVTPRIGIQPFHFEPFVGGITGLWREKNLGFPSGHACLAFATASALAILWPRWRFIFYAVAAATAIERVMENAHYVSDSTAGAALGVLSAYGSRWLIQKLIPDSRRPAGFPIELISTPSRPEERL